MKKIKQILLPIVMTINLNPKMIVTVLFRGLSFPKFLVKVKAMSAALITHTALFPDLDPTPPDFKIEVDKLDALQTKEENLIEELKSNTEAKLKQKKVVKNIATDKYANQIQNTPNVTVENIKLVGFGIKGVDDLQSDDAATVLNSNGEIDEIDANNHLELTLHIRNSKTGLLAIPSDAKRMDVYISFGSDKPTDVKKMQFAGSAVRGKFTYHFLPDNYKQDVWFIVLYVPRKKGVQAKLSDAKMATVL